MKENPADLFQPGVPSTMMHVSAFHPSLSGALVCIVLLAIWLHITRSSLLSIPFFSRYALVWLCELVPAAELGAPSPCSTPSVLNLSVVFLPRIPLVRVCPMCLALLPSPKGRRLYCVLIFRMVFHCCCSNRKDLPVC